MHHVYMNWSKAVSSLHRSIFNNMILIFRWHHTATFIKHIQQLAWHCQAFPAFCHQANENLQMLFPTTKSSCFDIITPGHKAPWIATFHGKGTGESHAFKISNVAVSCELCLGLNARLQRVPEEQQCHPTVPPQPPVSPSPSCTTSLGHITNEHQGPCPNQKGGRHQQKEDVAWKCPNHPRRQQVLCTKQIWKQFSPLI